MTKILGLWSGHDCSFCVFEDGKPIIHAELERYIREKEPKGDAVEFAESVLGSFEDIDYITTAFPSALLTKKDSYRKIKHLPQFVFGHHQSHAAHAFFSSNLKDAIILTIDGGGVEDDKGTETATTVWRGTDTQLKHVETIPASEMNIGGLWTRVTRYIFRLQNGWPQGHQAGTVMAMAALGNPDRFRSDFAKMLREDLLSASMKPMGQPVGAYVPGKDPVHPYLDRWAQIAQQSEQDKFDLAAGLQAATEDQIFELVDRILPVRPRAPGRPIDLCIAGGVALNSVVIGKLLDQFESRLNSIYVPPVPYDASMCLGSAQYLWHHELWNERIKWEDNFTPYLGEQHGSAVPTLEKFTDKVTWRKTDDDEVVDLLSSGKIVAVFHGGSESGRRALGNRSILADPRDPDMKDKINEKVKKRAWYRPFAPTVLRECVSDWFVRDVSSPYMSHVIKFKEERKKLVPAVVHFDGTARLQTVSRKDNAWYYDLIKKFERKTGVPIILDTSYNESEPVVENAAHAIQCYLRTEIDYIYFVEDGLLVERK